MGFCSIVPLKKYEWFENELNVFLLFSGIWYPFANIFISEVCRCFNRYANIDLNWPPDTSSFSSLYILLSVIFLLHSLSTQTQLSITKKPSLKCWWHQNHLHRFSQGWRIVLFLLIMHRIKDALGDHESPILNKSLLWH